MPLLSAGSGVSGQAGAAKLCAFLSHRPGACLGQTLAPDRQTSSGHVCQAWTATAAPGHGSAVVFADSLTHCPPQCPTEGLLEAGGSPVFRSFALGTACLLVLPEGVSVGTLCWGLRAAGGFLGRPFGESWWWRTSLPSCSSLGCLILPLW